MKPSEACLLFIASYETNDGKPNLKAVPSPEQPGGALKYEIGWGHNSDNYFAVHKDSVITYEQALDLLKHDTLEAARLIDAFIKAQGLKFSQNEYDAMISAVYNGVPLYSKSTGIYCALVAYCEAKESQDPRAICIAVTEVCKQWRRWVYMTVNGAKKKAQGLITRREDELDMFVRGNYERTR